MLSAGSQTVLPTVGFSPATTVEFTAAANTIAASGAAGLQEEKDATVPGLVWT